MDTASRLAVENTPSLLENPKFTILHIRVHQWSVT